MKPGDIDWEHLFGELGVRWFHTGGIFAALSRTTPAVILEALRVARRHGTICSYDLNFRNSLWKDYGGPTACQKVNREIAPLIDVMIGNEEDFTACLGLAVTGVDDHLRELPVDAYKSMIDEAVRQFPNFKVIATTLRTVKTATVNDWGALCWQNGTVYQSAIRENLEILDRVGGGDSFASGLIYGLLSGFDTQLSVDYGAAHGALAMTTCGDTSMAILEEVQSQVAGHTARVDR